ncbi:helix-turn-helix domain-containing protein [Urbifossiella limnaea]|uniref:hypothetical protein n=1 Tax=Urbifossiella limnaea TaxID=2528023 RepID=UPI0011A6F2C9|nr:hypothetical protein [Urbifossiella limnaea]
MSKFDQLRAAAASIEQLAADYHAALKPVYDALQAVADASFDDREKWAAAVVALARRLAENGLGDVPASRQGAGRWAIQFDNGKPGNAFAGHAFFAALAAAIADGSSPVTFFTTLDQYSFVPRAAGQEVCAALSNLLYVHKERVAPNFTAAYRRMLNAVEMDGSLLCLRLHRCDIRLSSDTLAAMHDWDECATGVAPCYTADIRPSQPVWAKAIDEQVSKLCVEPPPHLDPELAEAFTTVAVGIRECTRLIASVPYLWSNLDQYRRLAARVAESAAAARAAYRSVDVLLRRAGDPNAILEALNDVLTVHRRAPLDPNPRRDGLNAAITGLYTKRAGLFARVEGRGIIDRMLDQLARVPPATSTTVAHPPQNATPPADSTPQALTEKQREILRALDAKALTLDELATRLDCDKSRLHRDHLTPLKKLGRVANDRKVGGYYRPDAPPTVA